MWNPFYNDGYYWVCLREDILDIAIYEPLVESLQVDSDIEFFYKIFQIQTERK